MSQEAPASSSETEIEDILLMLHQDCPSPVTCAGKKRNRDRLEATEPELSDSPVFPPESDYSLCGEFLFSFRDHEHQRGFAKLTTLTCRVGEDLCVSSTCKVDARKSFCNKAFKRYYKRGIHALFAPNPGDSRILFHITQQRGKPGGKGFVGMRHEMNSGQEQDAAHLAKHPLLCLSSDSSDYVLSVFVQQQHLHENVQLTVAFTAGSVALQSMDGQRGADNHFDLCVRSLKRQCYAPFAIASSHIE